MKMAMTALAVVLLAPALLAAAPALAQDQPDRPGVADHDRPHRDGERGPRPVEAQRPPPPAPPPAAPQSAAPAQGARGAGHWNPGAGGYPGRGGVWSPGGGAPPAVQPRVPPPAPQPAPAPQVRNPDRDRFNGARNDGDRRNPDWRGGDLRDRDRGQDRDRDRDHDRDRDRNRDHDRDRDRDRHDGDRYRDGDRRDWGRYQGDTRNWGRYDQDRRWAGHEDRPRWEHGRYPPIYVSPHRYRGFYWRPPAGYYVRTWAFGDFLPRGWFGPEWFLDDPWEYDLPLPPPGFDWVRVGYDAILVDDYTGRIVQVVRNVFW